MSGLKMFRLGDMSRRDWEHLTYILSYFGDSFVFCLHPLNYKQ